MKIAVIAPTNLPARRANTIQVMKMCQAFLDLGHTVHLAIPGQDAANSLAAHARRPGWDELRKTYGLEGSFPIEWLPSRPLLRRYDYGWHSIQWARGLQADLIYTRLPQAAALASMMRLPAVFEIHDLPTGYAGPWLLRRFLGSSGARRVVAITQALKNDLRRDFNFPTGSEFLIVASDGVDLGRFQGLPEPVIARKQLILPEPADGWPQRFTAGYTGHLYPGRGAELLLELAQLEPEINFLLAGGEPDDVERLRRQAKDRGLTNVVLTGFIPNADLPQYQAACEVLLMPYQTRVAASSGGDIAPYLSPMKMFEYLACGRAILSSNLPVLREILNDDNAILLPPAEPRSWAQALQGLKNDPARRNRLAARARLDAQNYSWTARASRILQGL